MAVVPVLVYLAGPQDDVSTEQARGWRETLMSNAPSGVAFFSPAHAYGNVNPASFPPVDVCNRMVIRHVADAVIANLNGPGRAFGTIREIEWARAFNKPVVVIGEVVSLMGHDVQTVATPAEAMQAVLEAVMSDRQQPPSGLVSFSWPWQPPGQEGDG